jgi:hypothetical protein
VAAGGEVTAIDSAGFGPITITQAVTITSPDGVEAGIVPNPGGDAIDINAGPNDVVVLRGLTLNGSGVGSSGVVFNSGAKLMVTNCVVQNFPFELLSLRSGNGILIQPTSNAVNFVITGTIVSNNGSNGIFYVPQSSSVNANGVIDHVTATDNGANGADFFTVATSGNTNVAISNSIASNNAGDGIFISDGHVGFLKVSIDNTEITNNGIGIAAPTFGDVVVLSRSVVTFNGTAIQDGTVGSFYTYTNNQIDQPLTTLHPFGLQ